MKSFEELDCLVDCIISNKLDQISNFSKKEFVLFLNNRQKKELDEFLKPIGSASTVKLFLPETDSICGMITYRNFKFFIFETGYCDVKNEYVPINSILNQQ